MSPRANIVLIKFNKMKIKAKEVEDANSKGIDPKRVVVAIDGLSIIVSAQNPVDKLTVDQIGKIYRGEVKSWSEVGGNDTSITLYGRQSNSGTYDFKTGIVMINKNATGDQNWPACFSAPCIATYPTINSGIGGGGGAVRAGRGDGG